MYELPHELPNDLRNYIPMAFSPLGGLSCPHKKKKEIRKLGTFKKIPEMFGFDDEYPAVHPKVIEVFY